MCLDGHLDLLHLAYCRRGGTVEWRRAVDVGMLRCCKGQRAAHAEANHPYFGAASRPKVLRSFPQLRQRLWEVQVGHQVMSFLLVGRQLSIVKIRDEHAVSLLGDLYCLHLHDVGDAPPLLQHNDTRKRLLAKLVPLFVARTKSYTL